MAETRIVGVSDAELAALKGGRWEDVVSGLPGWYRWAKSEDGRRRVHQWVSPRFLRPGDWTAGSGVEETARFGSLDDALRWCDSKVEGLKILAPIGTATGQKDRFDEMNVCV